MQEVMMNRDKTSWQCLLGKVLLDKLLVVHDIPESDYDRLLALMEQYRDRLRDLADATLVLTAEKTG
jgi:predicted nucleic acid-binding protein